MKLVRPVVFGLALAVVGSMLAAAQDSPKPPMVLQITREFLKPYKGGVAHDKTESAFVAAMTKAKFPAYYVGLNSLSGRERALYFTHYDSFAEWEKDNKFIDDDKALSAELDRASMADGELLNEVDSGVFTFDEDLSYKSRKDLAHARFIEITEYHVRLGHSEEWHKLVKLVRDAYDKGGLSGHWSLYEAAYGLPDGTYLTISADDSMADIDKGFLEDKKFHEALGEDGVKEMHRLYGESVESAISELFQINPKQSYPRPEWVKDDPEFWKPKSAPMAMKAAAPKPSADQKKP